MTPSAQRWLVTGGQGMLARDVVTAAKAAGHLVDAPDRERLDITDEAALATAFASADVVVNCAAFTDVDGAEDKRAEAFALNAVAPGVMAQTAVSADATFVHISTDYVFSGDATAPYPADAPRSPRGVYAESKAEGEQAVVDANPDAVIVRAAWLYGAGGRCFPTTIARLARERGHVKVVDDQRGQPTWTADVARVIVDLVAAQAPGGAYHATAGGECSWYEFARAVIAADGSGATVEPCTTAAFPRPAPRPAYSVLAHDSLAAVGVEPIGAWEQRWAAASAEILATLD